MTLRGTSAPPQIGRYEILEELGRGAMGVVFKGRDPFIGRLVAVKTITSGIAENLNFLERFKREAQAAGSLQHPNIVTIYEMAEFEGTPFIAMEYLEGESLEKKIDGRARLPLVRKLDYLVQTCRALDYAHRRGVIHRDVKPANIMVTSEDVVKVVDFGIARIVDTAKTQTGAMLGTLSYMAPEQVRGQHADQRCDIWAVGVVMYELLTFRRPFDAENHAALLMSILNEEPRTIKEAIPDCPPALEKMVQRALRKDPAQRYQTVEAVLVDLEPIWTSMQREAVQKLMSHGRELMESGHLEEASEVLRKSLSLDTGNTAVKALFDQVNAMLEANPTGQSGQQKVVVDQNRQSRATPQSGKVTPTAQREGTIAATAPIDPLMTRVMDPKRDRGNPAKASSGATSTADRGEPGETIFAPSLSQALRSEPAKTPNPREGAVVKSPPARAATAPSTAPARRSAAIGNAAAPPSKSTGAYLVLAIGLLVILGAVGYWKFFSGQSQVAERSPAKAPSQSSSLRSTTAQPEASPSDVASPGRAAGRSAAHSPSAPVASIEDQQRHLIDLAHGAADAKDYKSAQSRLDEAAKLNGPLNPLIKDLRHEFSDEAHGAELRQEARREQSLWDRAMKSFGAGQWDDAEKPLREILTLPEAGRHWADAAQYVDEIIPERRHEDQLWGNEQQEMDVKGPEHRINEVKLLDQVLALGGGHQREARERRATLMTEFARNNLRKKNPLGPDREPQENPQVSQLEDAVDQASAQKDAKSLEQLQGLRPRFKSLVDAGGPRIFDARDYLNNVIPKAQKAIEDRLSREEVDSAANTQYRNAMKHFDQAVATLNTKMLRNQVQAEFDDIVKTDGPRTQEAAKFVSELIPAALKRISR